MPPPEPDTTLVIDFLNTVDTEHATDLLDDPRAFRQWCSQRGVKPADHDDVRLLRDGLRQMVAGRQPTAQLPPLVLPLSGSADGGLVADPQDVIQHVTAAVLMLTQAGQWTRIKLCRADTCREAFFDRSRNRSRTWCAMADCGNHAKVRTYRARTRSAE